MASSGIGVSDMMGASGVTTADSFVPVRSTQMMPIQEDYAPTPNLTNRMVVQNSYLSLLVTDVVTAKKKVIDTAVSLGGYMVNAATVNPQDAATATVTVRVPSVKLDQTLEMYRSLGVKVVSENLVGTDVTDQYVDIDSRVITLGKTKVAMEAILTKAELVSDLTNVTQQIINIQSQIDNLKGMQKSLEENAKLAKVTIYLSTDEIALPYAPTDTFRPNVIFKLAVRGLVGNLRSIGSFAIWLGVYAVIWVPVIVIIYFLKRRFEK